MGRKFEFLSFKTNPKRFLKNLREKQEKKIRKET